MKTYFTIEEHLIALFEAIAFLAIPIVAMIIANGQCG
jgi:hypothetical protein